MVAVARQREAETGFGKRLRELREEAGFTQTELGERADPPMSYQNIARLERGEREPNWPTVLRLAKALDVTPDAFLSAD